MYRTVVTPSIGGVGGKSLVSITDARARNELITYGKLEGCTVRSTGTFCVEREIICLYRQ